MVNKKNILLIGFNQPETMGWYLERTFRRMGHNTDIFCYRTISQKTHAESPVSIGFRHLPFLKSIYKQKINYEIEKQVAKNSYDLVIVLKGETISPKTLNKIKKKCDVLINWFMDPIITLETGYLFDSIQTYDIFFTKDMFIKQRLNEIGFNNVDFLLEGFDPIMYKKEKLNYEEKKRFSSDISFVGNIYPYRLKFLNGLHNHKLNLNMWGKLTHGVKKTQLSGSYQHRKAIGVEKNKIFNASKIVFNSHNPWEVCGTNVRTFEICGSGAFQLNNPTHYLDNIFKYGKELVCYNNIKELKELTKYYLENNKEREKIAERGYKRAHKDHTYENRINALFKMINRI